MKSKIIALAIAATTILGTLPASAATRNGELVTCGKYKIYFGCGFNKPSIPVEQEKPSTGDNNTVTPPSTGGDTTITPPSSDEDTSVTPPNAGGDNTETAPPVSEDDTTVIPPSNDGSAEVAPPSNGDTTTDNSTSVSENFMAQVEQSIFNKVNEERVKAGVAPLSYNTTMEKYARIKSQDMGDNNYFSHTDLNGNYITSQMQADGVSYSAWGENIAYLGGWGTDPEVLANQFMTNWMNSEGHRKNILSTNFTSIGVGVYKIGDKVYATQEFYR